VALTVGAAPLSGGARMRAESPAWEEPMGGAVYSLKRVSVTLDKNKLEQIADILGIVKKADRDSIIKDGVVISASTSAAPSTAQSARATTTRASTGRSTASRAKRPRK
jgi:hypothetical protein